jgi:hypothetical protein
MAFRALVGLPNIVTLTRAEIFFSYGASLLTSWAVSELGISVGSALDAAWHTFREPCDDDLPADCGK